MFRINREQLRQSNETPWLILDLVMLALLLVNLTWLIFDALYATASMQKLLAEHAPGVFNAYMPIHKNFLLIDLVFIAIFFAEFCFRWVVSVTKKEHPRWYFFHFCTGTILSALSPYPQPVYSVFCVYSRYYIDCKSKILLA